MIIVSNKEIVAYLSKLNSLNEFSIGEKDNKVFVCATYGEWTTYKLDGYDCPDFIEMGDSSLEFSVEYDIKNDRYIVEYELIGEFVDERKGIEYIVNDCIDEKEDLLEYIFDFVYDFAPDDRKFEQYLRDCEYEEWGL